MEGRRCGAIGRWERCTRAGVLLSVDHTLLGAVRFGEDLLEVLVAALRWAPVGIAEGFVDFVDV